jgi:hypothetical protein
MSNPELIAVTPTLDAAPSPQEEVRGRTTKIDFVRGSLKTVFEWVLLAGWTIFLLQNYLTLDSAVSPEGREYFISIYAHLTWEDFKECGSCAMWYGHAKGGHPAFADPHESMLHPVVVVATLLLGTINGAKIALVALFFLGGIAQWWLARVMGLGVMARLWAGAMAITAGSLAGKMNHGIFALVTSAVSAAFLLPALILLCRRGTRRNAAVLGLVVGLLLLSGQAYLQIASIFLSPLVLILTVGGKFPAKLLVRRFGLACVIALLTASPLLVPLFRFWSYFAKFQLSSFDAVQPSKYALLNLAEDDYNY